jgi:hypothetical protein
MSFWNPRNRRESLLRSGIAREHDWEYDVASPMGFYGDGMVSSMATAALVGLGEKMLDLMPRAIDWIDRAIARHEVSGPGDDMRYYHYSLIHAKALARWFGTGRNATEVWVDAFERIRELVVENRARAKAAWYGEFMDDAMACAFQAGRFADGVGLYEDIYGIKTLRVNAVRTPRQLAYAYCLEAVETRFSSADLLSAGRRLLEKQLAENWLHNGQMIRAATWLKIVYWHADQSLTPEQTMLKGYDDMPTVPRPDFL